MRSDLLGWVDVGQDDSEDALVLLSVKASVQAGNLHQVYRQRTETRTTFSLLINYRS